MVDCFWTLPRQRPVVSSELLHARPVRQQPGFKLELSGVRMKPGFQPDPFAHLLPGLGRIQKPGRTASRIDVRQCDDSIVVSKQSRHVALQPIAGGNSAILWNKGKLRHPAGQSRAEVLEQRFLEGYFGRALCNDGDALRHERPPRTPLLQSWSSVYSSSHAPRSRSSAHRAVIPPFSFRSQMISSFGSRNRTNRSEWVATIS